MIKSIGLNKIQTAIFISGNGSNFKKLYKLSLSKRSPITVCLVVSDNKNAKGLIYAKKYKLKKKIFRFGNKQITENKLLNYLKRKNIKLICLAGFMKILSKNFIKKFNGKILNIHPSLLPKFKGLSTHQRAIQNKEKFSGCTVHYVSPKLDSGKIILQKKVRISKKDTPRTLAKKVLKQEHILYFKAIKKIVF